MPGASSQTTRQSTAPRWSCARTEDTEVKRIVASDVAIAMWRMCSVGKPCQVNSTVRNGTISMPPPMPSNPAANPVQAPSSTSAPMNTGLMRRSFSSARVMKSPFGRR